MIGEEKIIKVGRQSDPSLIATAVLLAVQEGCIVKVPCIGEAIKVAAKAMALVDKFNANKLQIEYKVGTDYKMGDRNENDRITVLHFLVYQVQHKQIHRIVSDVKSINSLIDSYSKQGYGVRSMCPIVKDGNTSEVHLIFAK